MSTTVTYKGATLTTVSNDTAVLETAGKYLEDDLTLVDVSGGGSPTLQNKTVYPSSSDQSITADNGYDGLGTVTAKAVTTTNLTAANIVSGVTVEVGDADDPDRVASVTGTASGGGSGAVTIASGTFTGPGSHNFTLPIGTKMAQTDFLFRVWLPQETEFTYDGNIKITVFTVCVSKIFGYFDLSTDGTKQMSLYTVKNNNSGTITDLTINPVLGSLHGPRNGAFAGTNAATDRTKVIKANTGFSIDYSQNNSVYKFVSGMTYNWDILYFGSTPATDIVEVTI